MIYAAKFIADSSLPVRLAAVGNTNSVVSARAMPRTWDRPLQWMVGATRQGLREKRRLRMKRSIVLLTVATLVLGVLAVGAGYAKNENDARAKCSEATLDGTYLFAEDGFSHGQ